MKIKLILLSLIILTVTQAHAQVERFEKSGVALKKYVEVEQEYSTSYFEARRKELDEKQAQLNAEYAELSKLEAEAEKLGLVVSIQDVDFKK